MGKVKFLVLLVALIGIVSIGLADVSYPYLSQYGPAIVNWGSNVKYGGTLKIVLPDGPLQYSLNPFMGNNSTLPTSFIYESLFFINLTGDVTTDHRPYDSTCDIFAFSNTSQTYIFS
ncbi:MAG: hypothetical protein ACP5R1_07720, partial [Athalassotoga sp.]